MTDRTNGHRMTEQALRFTSDLNLADRSRQSPSRPHPGQSNLVGMVIGNNTLSPLSAMGCIYTATAPASIPNYDLSNGASLPTTVDGVGIARLRSGGYVLFANYAVGTIVPWATLWLGGTPIWFLGSTTLPISGGGTRELLIPSARFGP